VGCVKEDIWRGRESRGGNQPTQVCLEGRPCNDDDDDVRSDERGTGLLERITNDHRSLLQLQLYDVSDRDSGNSFICFIC